MLKVVLLAVAILIASFPAMAKDVEGEASPAFLDAKRAWLDGRDMEALRALSVLANDGNIAAKILLSRIADLPQFSAHVKAGMSRKEMRQLFREPIGLSGRDWLQSAAEESELARALWYGQSSELTKQDFGPSAAILVAYGERKTVIRYFIKMWLGDETEPAARLILENDELFGPAGRSLLKTIFQTMAYQGKGDTAREMVLSHPNPQKLLASLFADINAFAGSGSLGAFANPLPRADRTREKLAQMVRALPELRPLISYCERTCAVDQMEVCLAHGSFALNFGPAYPYPFSSPAPSLISDETYWSSSRFPSDVDRMMANEHWPARCQD